MKKFGPIENWPRPVKRQTVHPERLGKKAEPVKIEKRNGGSEELQDVLDTIAEDERRKGAWARDLRDPNPD